MRVKARIPSVKEVEVTVTRTSNVAALKQAICDKLGIEPELTKLLLDGKILDDKTRLSKLDLASKKITIDYFWARHLILWGNQGQSKLRNSTVLIAGAGALGNEVGKNLTMLGVKRLKIVDYDIVELSNVSRMVFFDKNSVGKPKAEVLAEALMKKYPYVEALAYNDALENLPLNVFLDIDAIVCGLDNVVSRMFLTSISRKYQIPMIDGGILGYQARVQVYVPPDAPCPACALPRSQYAQLVGLRNPCDAPVEDAKTPSLPTTISLVSSIQTQETIKILIGYSQFMKKGKWPSSTGEPLKGIWFADLHFNKYSVIEMRRNPNCMVCGKEGLAKDTVPRFKIPLSQLKNSSTALERKARSILKAGEKLELFKISEDDSEKISIGKRLTDYKIKQGDFIQALIGKDDEYKEAILRLV